jgi:hypothetical protein
MDNSADTSEFLQTTWEIECRGATRHEIGKPAAKDTTPPITNVKELDLPEAAHSTRFCSEVSWGEIPDGR